MKNIVCCATACLLRPRVGRRVARETEPELLDECVDVKGAWLDQQGAWQAGGHFLGNWSRTFLVRFTKPAIR